MADDLALAEIIPAGWLPLLEPVIEQQPKASLKRFLSKGRESAMIPKREKVFAALGGRPLPSQFNTIIIGQDPYPREESAVGIAFNDGMIKKWTDKLNPSFTNIMKAVLAHEGKMASGGDIAEFRKAAKDNKLIDPPQWFEHTQREGVMWINTALTFSSKDIKILKEHTQFWQPIVSAIFEGVIEAKKAELRKDPKANQGLVFIMWGDYAQKFRKTIEALNAKTEPSLQIAFVENNHPAATGPSLQAFHQNNSFTKANAALKGFGLPEVRWFAAEGAVPDAPAPAPSSSSSAAVKKGKAAAGEEKKEEEKKEEKKEEEKEEKEAKKAPKRKQAKAEEPEVEDPEPKAKRTRRGAK